MKNRRIRPIGLIGLILALAMPAFGAEVGGKPEKSDVVVSYAQASGAFTPIWVAAEAGLFKKYGLNAKVQLMNPQLSAQALISESLDFYSDGTDLINARLQGAKVKYFGGTIQRLVFQMWAAKEVASFAQLKGKAMAATTPRSALDTATRETLKRNGVAPDRDVQILYVQTVPAVLSSIIGGKVAAGVLSAPNTLKAKEAGLNLLADIAKLNIPGLMNAHGATEKMLKANPNTVYAFLKAMAEAISLSKKDPQVAKKAIAKYAQIDDPALIDGTYDTFEPYWDTRIGVRPEAVQAQFGYMDEKEFPNAKSADAHDFYDNSFVEALDKAGFLKTLGMGK